MRAKLLLIVFFVFVTLILASCAVTPKCIYIDPILTGSPILVEVYNRAYIDNEYAYLAEVDGNMVKTGSLFVRDTLNLSEGVHSFLYKMCKFDSKLVETKLFKYELKLGHTYVIDVDIIEEVDKFILKPKIKEI